MMLANVFYVQQRKRNNLPSASGTRDPRIKLVAIVVWLGLTLALAGWWLIFGLRQIGRVAEVIAPERHDEVQRWHVMWMSEGAVLLLLLLTGGIALLYLFNNEMKRSRQIRGFFAAFTHDLKTSLASLRLQAETLEEDLRNAAQGKVARRLVKDTVRLELQLDNSLFIADTEMGQLHFENVNVGEVISSLKHYWPELTIELANQCAVRADRRALESILKNLLQNAVVHGKATRVEVRCTPIDGGRSHLVEIADNGRGFGGDSSRLGKMFVRHTNTSGSGIGLFIANKLAKQMQGHIDFIAADNTNPQGFRARLHLPGVLR
jgi:signal transduction histidine kinase